MALSLLDSLPLSPGDHPLEGSREPSPEVKAFILGFANDLQVILGEDMNTAMAMSPHKPTLDPARDTLPRHPLKYNGYKLL